MHLYISPLLPLLQSVMLPYAAAVDLPTLQPGDPFAEELRELIVDKRAEYCEYCMDLCLDYPAVRASFETTLSTVKQVIAIRPLGFEKLPPLDFPAGMTPSQCPDSCAKKLNVFLKQELHSWLQNNKERLRAQSGFDPRYYWHVYRGFGLEVLKSLDCSGDGGWDSPRTPPGTDPSTVYQLFDFRDKLGWIPRPLEGMGPSWSVGPKAVARPLVKEEECSGSAGGGARGHGSRPCKPPRVLYPPRLQGPPNNGGGGSGRSSKSKDSNDLGQSSRQQPQSQIKKPVLPPWQQRTPAAVGTETTDHSQPGFGFSDARHKELLRADGAALGTASVVGAANALGRLLPALGSGPGPVKMVGDALMGVGGAIRGGLERW